MPTAAAAAEQENEDAFLPEHTISMRNALQYCQELVLQIKSTTGDNLPLIHVSEGAAESALTLPRQRRHALKAFWERQASGSGSVIVDVGTSAAPDALQFKKEFQFGNVPCLIRGLDRVSFALVCDKWRLKDETGTTTKRDWFRDALGDDALVPVRYQPSTLASLDDDGRAEECDTKEMSLASWIGMLDEAKSPSSAPNSDDDATTVHGEYYLKDWHLQSHLRDLAKGGTSNEADSSLYQVPPYFQYDLLNAFLTKFTKGDYKFTYWGPKGSRTSLHSDVMNSFSWSFNIAGTKAWVFYPPAGENDNNPPESSAVRCTQHAGECIFVSSGWKHEVVNLEETLSVNHNWITTANLDLTWDCMCSEMKAVETEVEAWGLGSECWDARESMLRGCFGLDVTAFFFVSLTRLLELLLAEHNQSDGKDKDDAWQIHFDSLRIKETLLILLHNPDQGLVCLKNRIAAVLQSDESAAEAIAIAMWATDCIVGYSK